MNAPGLERCELLPCPFCGSVQLRPDGPRSIWIHCCGCGADGPEIVRSYMNTTSREEAIRKAIAAWNRRAELARRVEGREAELARWVADAREAIAGCDWTAQNIERGFCVQDQFGEHTPCNVFMPDGAGLDFNHHAINGVDQSRAEFVSAACNAMLALLDAPPSDPCGLAEGFVAVPRELLEAVFFVLTRGSIAQVWTGKEDGQQVWKRFNDFMLAAATPPAAKEG